MQDARKGKLTKSGVKSTKRRALADVGTRPSESNQEASRRLCIVNGSLDVFFCEKQPVARQAAPPLAEKFEVVGQVCF